MAIAFVQSTTGTNTATPTVTTAFGASVTTGNLIVISVSNDSGLTGQITSITDTGGNTYTLIGTELAGSSVLGMYYAKNVTGGASFTVTVNWSEVSTGRVTVVAQEFSGCDTSSPLDQTAGTGATGTAVDTGATASTSQADELIVGGVSYDGVASTLTLGATFTNLGQSNKANASAGQESKVVSSVSTYNATFTIGASRNWEARVATFKAAGAAAAVKPSQPTLLLLGVG